MRTCLHCPEGLSREGVPQPPVFLARSRGQGEEAVAGVPEQQPLGHRWRGHPRAGGDGDRGHPLLEALPHRQAGLPARHRGQHSAAAEGEGQTPGVHPPDLQAGMGELGLWVHRES